MSLWMAAGKHTKISTTCSTHAEIQQHSRNTEITTWYQLPISHIHIYIHESESTKHHFNDVTFYSHLKAKQFTSVTKGWEVIERSLTTMNMIKSPFCVHLLRHNIQATVNINTKKKNHPITTMNQMHIYMYVCIYIYIYIYKHGSTESCSLWHAQMYGKP